MDIALTASLVSPIRSAEANGPHAVIIDLARGLAARGHRTTVYAAAGSSVDGVHTVEVPVSGNAERARVMPGGDLPAADLAADFAHMFQAVRAGGHDVLSQHAFDAPAISANAGIPTLHTLHLPPTTPAVVDAARAASAPLATVSAAARDEWGRAGVRMEWLLRNGVPDRGLRPTPPEPAALIAGRISPEKGTATGIRAALAAGLAPWVVGDVYDRAYFAREVRPLLADAAFEGPVERSRLAELMARAAVLVMAVEWPEPFGLVAAEAQMAGCPVVAYRRGALPEVVDEGVSGLLVAPDDEPELVHAIPRALALPRALVRASAQSRLDSGLMISAYEEALRAIARRQGPPRRLNAAAPPICVLEQSHPGPRCGVTPRIRYEPATSSASSIPRSRCPSTGQ